MSLDSKILIKKLLELPVSAGIHEIVNLIRAYGLFDGGILLVEFDEQSVNCKVNSFSEKQSQGILDELTQKFRFAEPQHIVGTDILQSLPPPHLCVGWFDPNVSSQLVFFILVPSVSLEESQLHALGKLLLLMLGCEFQQHNHVAELMQELTSQKFALDQHSIVAITDEKGVIRYVNEKFCQISQYSSEELLGQTHRVINSRYHEKDFFKDMWQTISRGDVWKGEIRNRRKDGEIYWVDTTIVPFVNKQKRPFKYVSIRTDITHKKLQQEGLKAQNNALAKMATSRAIYSGNTQFAFKEITKMATETLRVASCGIWFIDEKNRIMENRCYYQSANDTFDLVMGIDRKKLTSFFQEMERVKWRERKDWVELVDSLSEAMRDRDASQLILPLINNKHLIGVVRMSDSKDRQWTIEEQNFAWAVANAIVLSEESHQKRLAQIALEEAKEELHRQYNLKSGFLARMGHEVRTPMNGILGALELLDVAESDTERQQYLDSAKTSANNLLEMLDNLLEQSRMESHAINIDRSEFNFLKLINDIVLGMKPAADRKNLYFNSKTDGQIPEYLVGDSLRIRQVLNNLITNAIKFTNQGGINLEVVSKGIENNWIDLEIHISDTGIGISRVQQDKIFQSFVQADDSITRKYGGSGLGLTIVKQLVEKMGGEIKLISQPKVGSEFIVCLKLPIAEKSTRQNVFYADSINLSTFNNLRTIMGNDLSQLVDRFTQDAKQRISDILEGIRSNDREMIARSAQTLWTSSNNLGAHRLEEKCVHLVKDCNTLSEKDLEMSLVDIEREYDLVSRDLEQIVKH